MCCKYLSSSVVTMTEIMNKGGGGKSVLPPSLGLSLILPTSMTFWSTKKTRTNKTRGYSVVPRPKDDPEEHVFAQSKFKNLGYKLTKSGNGTVLGHNPLYMYAPDTYPKDIYPQDTSHQDTYPLGYIPPGTYTP